MQAVSSVLNALFIELHHPCCPQGRNCNKAIGETRASARERDVQGRSSMACFFIQIIEDGRGCCSGPDYRASLSSPGRDVRKKLQRQSLNQKGRSDGREFAFPLLSKHVRVGQLRNNREIKSREISVSAALRNIK